MDDHETHVLKLPEPPLSSEESDLMASEEPAVVRVVVVTVVVTRAETVTVVRVVGVDRGLPAVLAVVYGGGEPTVVVAAVVLKGMPPAMKKPY